MVYRSYWNWYYFHCLGIYSLWRSFANYFRRLVALISPLHIRWTSLRCFLMSSSKLEATVDSLSKNLKRGSFILSLFLSNLTTLSGRIFRYTNTLSPNSLSHFTYYCYPLPFSLFSEILISSSAESCNSHNLEMILKALFYLNTFSTAKGRPAH